MSRGLHSRAFGKFRRINPQPFPPLPYINFYTNGN